MGKRHETPASGGEVPRAGDGVCVKVVSKSIRWDFFSCQVLCCLLPPADDGDGGRLWGDGSCAESLEGHPHEHQYGALLLLLPLLPPHQDV